VYIFGVISPLGFYYVRSLRIGVEVYGLVLVVECLLRAGHIYPGKFVELRPVEVDVFV
jgi:hypothetical protein